MTIKAEDDVAGFLGVHMKQADNGTTTLTQKGLIDQFINAFGVEGLPMKHTPAEMETQRKVPTSMLV
jgi:hypothetical protein